MSRTPFAKRSLGQNFLVDKNYIEKIVAAVEPHNRDTIVEIGPGRGAITERLVASGAKVVAVELDRDLVPRLREQFAADPNFSVMEADATQVDFGEITREVGGAKLVANLPYYISTAILQHLATHRNRFSSLVLMFQKEVVDRIKAEPGNTDRGFLSVVTELSFEVEKLFDVPPTAFRPVPKVVSSVVRLTPCEQSVANEAAFRKMVGAGFEQKRKTILNNLKSTYPNAAEALNLSVIDPRRRAETLTLAEWKQLLGSLAQ